MARKRKVSFNKALLVSACSEHRLSWEHSLRPHSHLMHEAQSGFEAVALLQQHLYSIVIFDDTLPDMLPIEFALNLNDAAQGDPQRYFAGAHSERFAWLWERCGVMNLALLNDASRRRVAG